MSLVLWLSKNGTLIANGPVFKVQGGDIVCGELGQFTNSTVKLLAADRRAILAMGAFTEVEVVEDTVGALVYGYVLHPSKSITENGDGTITLPITPRAAYELGVRRTGRAWVAANKLSVIAKRLGGLDSRWTGVYLDAATVDPMFSASFNNPTVLAAYLQQGKDAAQFVRIGRDANGAPNRTLEMGQMGADTGIVITDANGGDLARIVMNSGIRLIAKIDREPNTVDNLINAGIPLGGGNASSTVLDLQLAWRIVNDNGLHGRPAYIHYGQYGSQADSMARTGKPSVFESYDPNYPIADPYTDNALTAYDGALGTPLGSRRATLGSGFDYYVYDKASVAAYGINEGDCTDSNITAADNTQAVQELASTTLYQATVAKFKRSAHPHHLLRCTVLGVGRPPREGDLVTVDHNPVFYDEQGAVVDPVQIPLRVVSAVRHFNGDSPPLDDLILSNLGRFEDDDTDTATENGRQLASLQIKQGTQLSFFVSGPSPWDLDSNNDVDVFVRVPRNLYRFQYLGVRCDFAGYRQLSGTALNTPGTPINIQVPTTQVTIAVDHSGGGVPSNPATGQWSATFDPNTGIRQPGAPGGFLNPTDTKHTIAPLTGAMAYAPNVGFMTGTAGAVLSLPFITMNPYARGGGSTYGVGFSPTANFNPQTGATAPGLFMTPSVAQGYVIPVGQTIVSGGNGGAGGTANATGGTTGTNPSGGIVDTTHPHPVPINNKLVTSTVLYGIIQQQNLYAPLPQHTHPLDQMVYVGKPPASITVTVNDAAIPSNQPMLSGTMSADGSFAGSFETDNLPETLTQGLAGQVLHFRFHGGSSSSNPLGVGRIVVTITGIVEFGGQTTIQQAG